MLNQKKPYVIAIDGPAGAGKGAIAKEIANKLKFNYLDSGAIYRVIAYAAKENNIESSCVTDLINIVYDSKIKFEENYIWLNSHDVSDLIRTESIGKYASKIAMYKELRVSILNFQRDFLRLPGLVAEGRDMTSIVFPDADLKIYLNASVNERVKRRYKQLISKGNDVNLSDLTREIETRDSRDKNREVSPLLVVKEAYVLETDNLTEKQTVDQILSLFNKNKKL